MEPNDLDLWQLVGRLDPEPICVFDTGCRLIAFNPAHDDEFFRVNGFRSRIGDVFPDLFLGDQAGLMRSLMRRALDGEAFTVVEAFGRPERGMPQWEISYTPLRDATGAVFGAFHRARDLTAHTLRSRMLLSLADARRGAEDADLRHAVGRLDDRLRDLDDPDTIAALCAQVVGETLDVAITGFGTMLADDETLEVVRGWSAPGAADIAGRHRLTDYGDFLDLLRRGHDFVVADIERDPRTAATPAGWRAKGVRSAVNVPVLEGGRYVAMFFVLCRRVRHWTPSELGFIRNVAERARLNIERRRAELDLRRSAASLEHQVDDRTRERDLLWDTSVDLLVHGDFKGTIFRRSPSWSRTLGHDPAFLEATPYLDLVHPDDVEGVIANMRVLRREGRATRRSTRLRHADGSWRTIDWSLSPSPEGDGFNAVGRDVTAGLEAEASRHLLEEQLRQSQKMEAVGQLTGGLAHDFNNLLAGIMGALELMQRRIALGQLTAESQGRYIATARGAATRAASLTHRLLAFSRRQPLDPRPIDVDARIADMRELVQRTVGPTIEVATPPAPDLWTALLDGHQLENAILNLCINSRDAMPGGGRITITAANQRLDERTARERDLPAGEYVSVGVADTGAGMSDDTRTRAFEPFFTTKPMGQGTGLGLSMVYGFARQSGGQARIESRPGGGTTVSLYFPRHAGPGEAPDAPADSSYGANERAGTALLVEDEPSMRLLMAEVLREQGLEVREADHGAAGLHILQSELVIDLVVTDIGLPGGMNGRQMIEAARPLRPHLKVLYVTGYAESAVVGEGLLTSHDQLLTKPFALDAFAARVGAMTGRR
jgi:PAS domain S-box-containing protein